jgi:hypothetical protein
MPMTSTRVKLTLGGVAVLALAALLVAYTDTTWEEIKPIVDRAEVLIGLLIGADTHTKLGAKR